MKVELDQVKNSACNKCETLESKVVELNQVLKKYEKWQLDLKNVINKQRYSNDKCEIGYSKFDKPIRTKLYFLRLTINSTMRNQRNSKLQFILRRPMLKIMIMFLKIRISLSLHVFISIRKGILLILTT